MTRAERIGYNFRRLKQARGWTNAEAARRGECGVNYISQVEGALISFGTRAQEKWAKIFGVDVKEFFREPSEMYPDDELTILSLYRTLKEINVERAHGVIEYLEFNISRIRRTDPSIE